MARKLTQVQEKIMTYISDYTAESGISPSVEEIANEFNITGTGAQHHIKALTRKGYIESTKGKARSIHILDEKYATHTKFLALPFFEQIPTLDEYLSFDSSDRYYISSKELESDKEYFAVRNDSSSLELLGININDILIFLKSDEEIQNSLVIASCSDDDREKLVLRRLFRVNDKIELRSESSNTGVISVSSCEVIGILSLLVRGFSSAW